MVRMSHVHSIRTANKTKPAKTMIGNEATNSGKLARRAFALLLAGLGANRLLDVGAGNGTFAMELRQLGFTGLIYSVEALAGCRRQMTEASRGDLRWIVLPNQGAGAENGVMNLNVSQNVESSTVLTPQDPLEPSVQAASGVWVYVSKTCGLLPPAIMGAIDGLKIARQGDEPGVLKGLAGHFGSLKLILVEHPVHEDVEQYITDMGFQRPFLIPAKAGRATGASEQGEGIYVRRDLMGEATALLANADAAAPHAPARTPGGPGTALAAVVISLPGRTPKRPDSRNRDFGPHWLESCYRSWTSHAPRVISISEAEPILPGVRWRKVARKPELRQIFASLAEAPPPGEGSILLTNADIILGPQLSPLLAQMDPHVLYYCSRLDVRLAEDDPRNLELAGEYVHGYDAFFLPREIIAAIHGQRLIPAGLMIGEPFWDYALPIAALVAGHPTKKFFVQPHPIVHLSHDPISRFHLSKTGLIFISWLRELLRRPPSPTSGIIAEFVAAYDQNTGDDEIKRRAMCRIVRTSLT
jgi:FkbM family methyltransferase